MHTATAQIIPVSFPDLVSKADSIVVAEAIETRSEWVALGRSRTITDTNRGHDDVSQNTQHGSPPTRARPPRRRPFRLWLLIYGIPLGAVSYTHLTLPTILLV